MSARSLIVLEHDRRQLKRPSLHAITAAQQLGDSYAVLLIGHDLEQLAESVTEFGATEVLVADHPALAEPLADRYAKVIQQAMTETGAAGLIASSSTFSKDILPRVAAQIDAPMLTDVIAIEQANGNISYRRPTFAGSMLATVHLSGQRRVLTIRASAFEPPAAVESASSVQNLVIDEATLPQGMKFVSREERASDRPDLTEAKVVIGGGHRLGA
jgi:electron transfer flavoprotein alpha subunit